MQRTAKKIHDDLMDIVGRDLGKEEVKLYKKRLKDEDYGGFRGGEIENMDTMADILTAQEKRRILTIGNYSKLKEQLKIVGNKDLVEIVTEYEEKLMNQALDAPDVASSSVKKKRKISDCKDPSNCYSPGKGYVLYISIFVKEKDDNGRYRDGVKVDKENIRKFFEDRAFTINFIEDTRSPEELWEAIEDAKTDAESKNSSSFFFIISSHGKGITLKNESGGDELHKYTQKPVVISEEIQLVGRNEHVRVDEIVSKFENFMSGKPKVLIFQACRSLPELRVRDRADDGSSQADVDDAVRYYSAIIPGNADMVVVHDTSRGERAYRNKKDGAWLFKELFVNLDEEFKTEHLLDVLTGLNNLISKRKTHEGKAGLQMSCFISTLTKFFYLTK